MSTRVNAVHIDSTDSGSNSTAASPATSGNAEVFAQTTAVPLAIASSTGIPNPSYSDGKTNARALASSP
ncbi:MAG: hypothetical protein DWI55_03275 [Chloroflexi bacterium]|nr:MAG: hypothetical protein DWI55_03275 [Chloroflexota bacterium]